MKTEAKIWNTGAECGYPRQYRTVGNACGSVYFRMPATEFTALIILLVSHGGCCFH